MKKKLLFTVLYSAILLSGCSGASEYLDDQIRRESGIAGDENYQVFQRYLEEGKLDDEGYYLEESFNSDKAQDTVMSGTVKVSFSENQYLDVKYYSDVEMTKEIRQDESQIAVGSSIYTNISLEKTIPSTSYGFAGFRIFEVDADGERTQVDTLVPDENGFYCNLQQSMKEKI
ncbi:MAG: hypothetical protein K6B69_04280 [Lachnospiraceae bacterium]|nr:hypothetical protein [Lachnospiraceae bacterium]